MFNINKGQKDYKNRVSNKNNEMLRLVNVIITANKVLKIEKRTNVNLKIENNKINSTRVFKNCLTTGRARGLVGEYKLCRQKFKQLAEHGLLSGIKKASW